jgi:vacuolar-type H+-ATPase subunit H
MQIIDPLFIYIVIFIFSALAILLVVVISLYLATVKKYFNLKEGKLEETDPQVLLRQAQEKAQKILNEAQQDARETIANAKTYLDVNQNLVSKELQNATQIYAKKYEQILLATQDQILKMIRTIPEDTKKSLLTEINTIRSRMEEEVNKATQEAKSLVTGAYKRAEIEVDEYKNERMRQIDESIVMILKEVARKVLAKEISQEEHEKLVIKALEEAKRQGVFENKSKTQTKENG